MKFLALSMGIPNKSITLEQKANSTYENVKYSYDILKKRHFDEVMLITSPYNMLRASLVFRNIAPDLKVVYVPIQEPQFYRREGKVKLEQIRAIMHEYLGILHYIYKGYIKLW